MGAEALGVKGGEDLKMCRRGGREKDWMSRRIQGRDRQCTGRRGAGRQDGWKRARSRVGPEGTGRRQV